VAVSNTYAAAFLSRTSQTFVTRENGPYSGQTPRTEPSWRRWLVASAVAGALQLSPASADNLGQWGGTIPFPNIPVSAALLPTGKLLTWSSYQPFYFEQDIGTAASKTYTGVSKTWGSLLALGGLIGLADA